MTCENDSENGSTSNDDETSANNVPLKELMGGVAKNRAEAAVHVPPSPPTTTPLVPPRRSARRSTVDLHPAQRVQSEQPTQPPRLENTNTITKWVVTNHSRSLPLFMTKARHQGWDDLQPDITKARQYATKANALQGMNMVRPSMFSHVRVIPITITITY